MWLKTSTMFFAFFMLVIITVDAGLLRVPKIYNTVITSDANLEPSRAYPIIQPVLTVQPVVAAAAVPGVEDQRSHAAYYSVDGLYPFLTGTNALYPSPVLYQHGYGAQQPAPVPYSPAESAFVPVPPVEKITPQPQFSSQSGATPQNQVTQKLPDIPPMPASDVLNNHNRMKNPEIPDVPPPPLPVSAKKKT